MEERFMTDSNCSHIPYESSILRLNSIPQCRKLTATALAKKQTWKQILITTKPTADKEIQGNLRQSLVDMGI
jgi:hypothetical protein